MPRSNLLLLESREVNTHTPSLFYYLSVFRADFPLLQGLFLCSLTAIRSPCNFEVLIAGLKADFFFALKLSKLEINFCGLGSFVLIFR